MGDEVASPTSTAQPEPAGDPGGARQSTWLRRWWWLAAVLVVVSIVVVGAVTHAVAQGHAARKLYDTQVLTTAARFIDEEQGQIELPVAERNVAVFGDLAHSISADPGVNGAGTLRVTTGAGSVARFTQIAFEVTVSSRYASTTFAAWFVRGAGSGGMNQQNVGTCVLSSSLLGSRSGRATASISLGASGMQPCWPQLWSASSNKPMQPHLAWANISQPAGS